MVICSVWRLGSWTDGGNAAQFNLTFCLCLGFRAPRPIQICFSALIGSLVCSVYVSWYNSLGRQWDWIVYQYEKTGDGLKAVMNDSFNSYITASKYPTKLSHKMWLGGKRDQTTIVFVLPSAQKGMSLQLKLCGNYNSVRVWVRPRRTRGPQAARKIVHNFFSCHQQFPRYIPEEV
jgi:hypothetical protein